MAENREEILANFQGITAIEDVAEAIYHLEEANWDLLAAINRVMPQDASSSATHDHDNDTHDVEMIDDDISVITPKTHPPDREDQNQASTSTILNYNPIPIVELQVHCNNKIHEVKISANATVDEWNTPGTSSQPTVAAPLPPPPPQPPAPTPPSAPAQTQWQPPKKKKKAEGSVINIFKDIEENAREYERERDRITQDLERERIRQRDLELQLKAQWLDFMKEALQLLKSYLDKRGE